MKNKQKTLRLGNLDAMRDWGYAPEYVECMWLMLQQQCADDYVIGTGNVYTVREFVEKSFQQVDKEILWRGQGAEEKGYDATTGDLLVELDSRYLRPTEVDLLQANPEKSSKELGWTPKTSFEDLVSLMVKYDLEYEDYGNDMVFGDFKG